VSDANADKLVAGTWAGESKGASVTISLSSDGKFQTVFNGGTYRAVVKGIAKLQESTLLLEATEFDGKPSNRPARDLPVKFNVGQKWATLTSESGITLVKKI
jgi:hypothetical protein